MDLLIRTLLIWLLALAIPAQGVAAATMVFCGAAHHGVVAAGTAGDAAGAGPAHGEHEAVAAHDHPHADVHAPADDGVGEPAEVKVVSAAEHKCNVCGSCCATGALVSTLPALPVVAAASTAFPPGPATVDPFSADGPERPPRNLCV